MLSLDEIGQKTGTDKASGRHDYLGIYDLFLSPLREREITLLEIGVLNGASLRMWSEYFPKAQIVGLDIKEFSESFGDRVTTLQGSQGDIGLLTTIGAKHRPHVIIDDGSHYWAHQVKTFEYLFPFLQDGGIYICEDLQTSFGDYPERFARGYPETAADYFARLTARVLAGRAENLREEADPLGHYLKRRISTMTYREHTLIIQTRAQPLPSRRASRGGKEG